MNLLSTQSALQGPSEQGARRCANAKLITLRGATLKMAHVIASLVTKENTAQRVSSGPQLQIETLWTELFSYVINNVWNKQRSLKRLLALIT